MTDWEDFAIPAIIVAAVVICVLGIVAMVQEGREWEAFKSSHACEVVGKMTGETFNTFGVGTNGQMVVGVGSTSGKTGFKCNDGVTYWR